MPGERRIGIAGAGRIAQALGRLLRERGQTIAAVAGRDPQRTLRAAEFIGGGTRAVTYAELPSLAASILIAVPDDAIENAAAILAEAGMRGGAAVHTCGSRGPGALARLEVQGVSCAALHPLQTVATPEQGMGALPGSAFGVTGTGAAAAWASEIAALLGGEVLTVDAAHRPIYHAAAVMASNYLTTVLDAAVILMEEAGIKEEQTLRALAPLVRASVENSIARGPLRSLTGPIERGDTGTVAAHLEAMAPVPESVRGLYRAAGLHAVQMALRKAPGADRRKMEWLLREKIDDE